MEELERLNWSVMGGELLYLSIYPPVPAHQLTGNQRRSQGCRRRPGWREGGGTFGRRPPHRHTSRLPLLRTNLLPPLSHRNINTAPRSANVVLVKTAGAPTPTHWSTGVCDPACDQSRPVLSLLPRQLRKCFSTCDGVVGSGEWAVMFTCLALFFPRRRPCKKMDEDPKPGKDDCTRQLRSRVGLP